MPKTTSEEKLASPGEGISAFEAVGLDALDEDATESGVSGVARTLFQENMDKDNQIELRQKNNEDDEEEKK